jgi:hypothetical protein
MIKSIHLFHFKENIKDTKKGKIPFLALNPRPSGSMRLTVILASLNTLQSRGNAFIYDERIIPSKNSSILRFFFNRTIRIITCTTYPTYQVEYLFV